MKSYLEGCNLGYSGLPTPMGYATGRRARLQPAPEQRLPAADACAFALAKGGFGRPCGLYEHVPEFPLRLAGMAAHGREATECASDGSTATVGRRIARSGIHSPGMGRAGYAEIFRV